MTQLVYANDTKNYILYSFLSKKHFKVVSVSTYVLKIMLPKCYRVTQITYGRFLTEKFDYLSAPLRKRGC